MGRYYFHLIGASTWQVADDEETFQTPDAAYAYGRRVAQELAANRHPPV